MKNAKVQSFLLLLLLFLFPYCEKNEYDIPYRDINIIVSLYDPEFNSLNAIGNSVAITGGVKGIIIYRKSLDEFRAYEQTCPYDSRCGRVTIDKSGVTATDQDCCKSQYSLIIDGAVLSGSARLPLKQYECFFNPNTNVLNITN